MHDDALALTAPRPHGDCHVERGARGRAQLQVGAGASVAEDRPRTTGENSGHPTAFGAERGVPDRVDTLMHAMKPAGPEPMVNRAALDVSRHQLSSANHPML